MATMEQLRAAERDMRALIEGSDLPDPDDVEYGEDSVYFVWHEQKLVVAVDITEPLRADA